MDSVNLTDVASNLTRLIERAEAGEEITIFRAGRPVARLMPPVEGEEPIASPAPPRQFGQLAGRVWVGDDFDGPLPEDIARAFRGECQGNTLLDRVDIHVAINLQVDLRTALGV